MGNDYVEVTIPGNETDEVECVEKEDNKQRILESAKRKERRVSDNILGIQRQDKDFTLKITKSLSPIPLRKKSQPNTLSRSTGSSSCASPSYSSYSSSCTPKHSRRMSFLKPIHQFFFSESSINSTLSESTDPGSLMFLGQIYREDLPWSQNYQSAGNIPLITTILY